MDNFNSKNSLDKKKWPWNFTSNEVNQEKNAILPKITIVTPSYNQADFLEETILSIINQNYPNLEYIIIDGGSTDNSVEIIKKYGKHIDYWVSEKDFGQSHAINKGFAKASGDILNWINSDDVLCENALLNIGKAYLNRKNDNIIIAGNGYEIDENSTVISDRMVFSKTAIVSNMNLSISGNPIQQSLFFSKKLLLEVGGINPLLRYPMDMELHSKFEYLKPEIFIIEEYLASFRKHSNSKTVSQDYKMLLEKINLIKYLSFYVEDKKEYLNQISSYIASFSFQEISFKQKLQLFQEFIKVTSFNKKNRYKFRILFNKIVK
jgi:glycosyltransferase involved in cell wall biosynthesis